MDKKIVFIKTDKGESEANDQSDELFGDVKRILHLVDNESTVTELHKRAPPSLRAIINEALQELFEGGYIHDKRAQVKAKSASSNMASPAIKVATPQNKQNEKDDLRTLTSKITVPKKTESNMSKDDQAEKKGDLDFSFISAGVSKDKQEGKLIDTGGKSKVQAEEVAKAQLESMIKNRQEEDRAKEIQAAQIEAASRAAKLKAYAEAKERAKKEVAARARLEAESKNLNNVESVRMNAEKETIKARAELEETKIRIETEIRARVEAEIRIKQELEANSLKAEKEAEKIRLELEAKKVKSEAEIRQRIEAEARAKVEKEVKAKQEAEARAKQEAEARAKQEAEARAKQEADAKRIKAEKDAENIRIELEAVKAKAEAELRQRAEAEARVKAEVEARINREIESARLEAKKDAEKLRLELDAVKAKAEVEMKHRLEAEARAKEEAAARIKREAEAELLRVEKEKAELEIAKVKAATEILLRQEAEARIRAEVESRIIAESNVVTNDRRQSKVRKEGVINGQDQTKQAEILRKSFVESFGQTTGEHKANSLNFKLDTFSLVNTGKMPVANLQQQRTVNQGVSGSKVKEAFEKKSKLQSDAAIRQIEKDAEQLHSEKVEASRLIEEQERAQSKLKAEQESLRLKAEHEAYRLKAEQVAAREKEEAEVRKLAEQQTKQWEEAQRRAAVQADAEKERLLEQQSAKPQQNSRQKLNEKAHRKSFPLGKTVMGLTVVFFIAMVVIPTFWPTGDYIAPLEKEIGEKINQTVHISKIKFVLLPLPKLVLNNFTVGGGQEFKVTEIALNFNFSALFSSTKPINTMVLNGVVLKGASLDKVLVWLRVVSGSENYPISQIDLKNAKVMLDEIQFPALNGKAHFDGEGKFSKAEIKSEDGKYVFELKNMLNRLQLELNIHETSLPFLPAVKFNDLSANGVLENGEILFSDIFAHVYGGTLTGKAQLNWFDDWNLQGQINAKSLELQRMFTNLGVLGELYGDTSIAMSGSSFSKIGSESHMEGTFTAKNGIVNKLDIDTIARFGASQGGAGGTNFSNLVGTFKTDDRGIRLALSKISAGTLTGSGNIEVDKEQQLSGKLIVVSKGLAGDSVQLRLSGTANTPILKQGR